MIAQLRDMSLSMEGELRISLSVPRMHGDELQALKGELLDVSISKHRERRSRNANAYMWELIGQLKDKMRMSQDECYLMMLKRYGQGRLIAVQTSDWETVSRELDYYEVKGYGKVNGIPYTHVMMWVGSSKYNTYEMSILVDGIVNECHEQGIDTDTPEQIMKMDERYHKRYG